MRIGLWIMGTLVALLAGLFAYEHLWPLGQGTLVVVSDPPGAQVWLDLKPTTLLTDARISRLSPGMHSIMLKSDTLVAVPLAMPVQIQPWKTDTVRFRLVPRSPSPSSPPPSDAPPTLPEMQDTANVAGRVVLENKPFHSESAPVKRRTEHDIHDTPPERQSAPVPTPVMVEGLVTVTSTLSDARIFVDGIDQGVRTPATLSLPRGEHIVSVELSGHTVFPPEANVRIGMSPDPQSLFFDLTPATTRNYQIDIRTEPVSGQIYLDGVLVGEGNIQLPREPGQYTVSFGNVEGWEAPQPATVSLTPTQSRPQIKGVYTPVFRASTEVNSAGEVASTGGIRWSVGVFVEDEGAQATASQGAKIREIPDSQKRGWELGIGDPTRNPTGGDYVTFVFNVPPEVRSNREFRLRLYLYRSDKRYPFVFSGGQSDVVVSVNGRTFLGGYRPLYATTSADQERYEEWPLGNILVDGENRIMIRVSDQNSLFNYLWKLEVL